MAGNRMHMIFGPSRKAPPKKGGEGSEPVAAEQA
jgi:hypothetical protein